jgi:hypothetical protein
MVFFHVSVFIHFCEAFVGIKPYWILFRKFFRVKPQPSANDPRVVGGANQYLAYKLIDSDQVWKAKWFYITNHHPRAAEAKREAAETSGMVEH